jgi:hypothetical protein
MLLYHFNPHDYDLEFFVMADNKIEAHKALLTHLEVKSIKYKDHDTFYRERVEIWKKVDPLQETTFPNEYTLDVYGQSEVVESEVS